MDYFSDLYPYPNIFEISPHPSPLPSGERVGVRGQNVRRKF
jgi:hypothetical protein